MGGQKKRKKHNKQYDRKVSSEENRNYVKNRSQESENSLEKEIGISEISLVKSEKCSLDTKDRSVEVKIIFKESENHFQEPKEACKKNQGAGGELKKQKKDWIVIGYIVFAIVIGLMIYFVALPESEQPGLGENITKGTTANIIKEQIYSSESLKNVLGFGLQTFFALSAFGIAVSQVSGKRAREKSEEGVINYKKTVSRYFMFLAVVSLYYVYLFIIAEYGSKTGEYQNDFWLYSVIAVILMVFSILYFISVFNEMIGEKIPKVVEIIVIISLTLGIVVIVCIALKTEPSRINLKEIGYTCGRIILFLISRYFIF